MRIKKVIHCPLLDVRFIALQGTEGTADYANIIPDGSQYLLTLIGAFNLQHVGRRKSVKQCYKLLRSL